VLKRKIKRENGQQPLTEKGKKPKKPTALERFGRDLTALAAEGALSPLIGRRAELIWMTQVLLQSRKNNFGAKAETLKTEIGRGGGGTMRVAGDGCG